MTRPILDRQSELPRLVPLFRYAPARVHFSWQGWDPSLVRSTADLPPYLILGDLDPSTFEHAASGWSARWQGTEDDTHFDVAYKADTGHWEVRQTWCGVDGGYSLYSVHMPLDKVIAQALYLQFPRNWDSAAKSQLESTYQVTVVEQPKHAYNFCGIPDGTFRIVIFPIAVSRLRPVRQWLQALVEKSPLAYPVNIEAKLVFQAINYVEDKAPTWTTQGAEAFCQSMIETGLVPHGLPVREAANDGTSAAWTLRREIYFLFITLPFASLTDFLSRMATKDGPIRASSDPNLRFELRPVVIPCAYEMQTESVAFWDQTKTTRSFLQFRSPGEKPTVSTVEQIIDADRDELATLARAETISSDVVTAIEQRIQRVTKEGA